MAAGPARRTARRPATTHRRRTFGLVVLLAVAIGPGCGGQTGDPDVTCFKPQATVEAERPVEVPYEGPTSDSSELVEAPAPRLVVQLTNNELSVERVRLRFDGVDALDVDLPASLGCGNGPPVYSVAYDRPPGTVEVELDLQGATSTTTIDVPDTGTAWAVVDVQSEREWGDITVYDTKPAWG